MGGLQLVSGFSPSIRMWMDASYFKIHRDQTRWTGPLASPVIEPPSDDFAFKKRKSATYPSVLRRACSICSSPEQMEPIAGLGYGTASLLYHDVIYEFENPLTGEGWSFDGSVPGNMWKPAIFCSRAGWA